jgi:hypothetical protein
MNMDSSRARPLAVAAGVLLLLLVSQVAHAQPTDARRVEAERLVEEASKLRAQHKYDEACPKLVRVVSLQPGKIGALFALAECWEEAGKHASAQARYREAADTARAAGDPRMKEAESKALALEPRVPRLQIVVPVSVGQIGGLEIQRDGQRVEAAKWAEATPLDPGQYRVSASAPGKKPWSSVAKLGAAGGTVSIRVPELEEDSAAPAPNPPPSTHDELTGTGGVPAWPWAVGSVGLVSLGVAAGFGIDALLAANTLKQKCSPVTHTCDGFDPTAENARKNRGLGLALGFGGAGVIALTAAVVGIVKAPSAHADPPRQTVLVPVVSPGKAGAVLRGAF